MKLTKIISSLAIAAVVALGTLGAPNLRAQDTPAPAAAPAAPAAAEAKKEEAKLPEPTADQNIGMLSAYVTNSDPSAVLKTAKDKDGNPALPEALAKLSAEDLAKAFPLIATSGPGTRYGLIFEAGTGVGSPSIFS